MSLKYGFYNSISGDRKYDATDMSAIFDGIINDGIFASVGDALVVTAATGMTVNIGTGRAWFNSTWTQNDAILPLTLDVAGIGLSRIDAIVLEVNTDISVRQNSIKIVKGTPSSTPVAPVMVNTEFVHQYPLALIDIPAGLTEIIQANITNKVGTGEVPFITGILETVDTDALLAQWDSEFGVWFEKLQSLIDSDTPLGGYKLYTFEEHGVTATNTDQINITTVEWYPDKDPLMFFVGGIYQTVGVDYTLDKINRKIINISGNWEAEFNYDIQIYKNILTIAPSDYIDGNLLSAGSVGRTALTPAVISELDEIQGKIDSSLATAANDFLVATGVGVWDNKTLAETKTLLGVTLDNILALLGDSFFKQSNYGFVQSKSASFTLALTDVNSFIKMTSGSSQTITVPKNSVVAIPVGSTFVFAMDGAGAVVFAPVDGTVTIKSKDSKKTIDGQYSEISLTKTGVDEWYLAGSLKA